MSNLPEINSEYASDFKRIQVGGVFGGVRSFGVEAVIYSERQDIQKVLETQPLSPQRTVIKRVVECELAIDPMQLKSIHRWLGQKIEEYEKFFGTIPSPEELDSKFKRQKGTSL